MDEPGTVAGRGAPPERHDAVPAPDRPTPSAARRTHPPRGLHAAVVAAALVPAVLILAALASDALQGTRYLGSNPIKEAEHRTGAWALRFLGLTLAVTPAVRLAGRGWLMRYRRTFGLVAFGYAVLHLLVYAVLDVELSWGEMLEDVAKRLYITIGMTAFVLLVPLALTSTRASVRRLGSRRWTRLHRAVYACAVLGVVHFWMSVKQDILAPLVYALVLSALLGWRVRRGTRRAGA